MSIARYDLTEDCTTGKVDITPVPETMEGRYVSYEDYAALGFKCAALVAENAGLKEDKPDLQTMMSALDAFFADEEVPERAMLAAYNILRGAVETPATDAFLAEVRASELDSLAGVAEIMLVKFANHGASDHPESKGWEMIFKQASQRAAQLRKGVQS